MTDLLKQFRVLSFKSSQYRSAAFLQRPEDKRAEMEEYDVLLANMLWMLERQLQQEISIDELEKVCTVSRTVERKGSGTDT